MFEAVYSWITRCLQFALDTFVLILDKTDTGSFYLSGLFLIAIFGFLLAPFVSHIGPGSDRVSNSDKGDTAKKPQGRYGDTPGDGRAAKNMEKHGFKRAGDL